RPQDHGPHPEHVVSACRPESAEIHRHLHRTGIGLSSGDAARLPHGRNAIAPGSAGASALNWAALERVVIGVALATFYLAGYYAVALSVDAALARELATPLDCRLSFDARWVWVYVWAYPAALAPLFFVCSRALLRRVALAYAATLAVCFGFFAVMPV